MWRPRIALTLGDVAGIGPEVVARACADGRLRQWCKPVVVGHPEVLRQAASVAAVELDDVLVPSLADVDWDAAEIPCWNSSDDAVLDVPEGKVDARAGRAAYDSLIAATRAALKGEVDALTTAPISKAALNAAGLKYPGHTEILAEECGVSDFAMMLYLPQGGPVRPPQGLGVAHVTLHTSIRSVPDLLTPQAVQETIHLLARFMRDIGCRRPRIAVCALNPHAGEEGLFGNEEQTIIAPGVAEARHHEIDVTGPLPADTLLRRAVNGEFDGVVAMYHDQGHIAFKLIGFGRAVNVTLGLPIVRTSPSHGTAFDIAGKGRADADGFREAVRIAALLAQQRRTLQQRVV